VIAFVCAMPMEVEPLVRQLGLEAGVVGGVDAHVGDLDGRRVVAIVTGMGTSLAARGVTRLLDAVPEIERVLVVGITGALETETPIGTLVRPVAVVDSASGAEFVPAAIGDDAERSGRMWTGDRLITDLAELADLRARGVVCLDMETAAIARVCEERGVPWTVFRAISDRACDGTVNDEVFQLSNQDGTTDEAAVTRYLAEHPERVPALMQMAKDAELATGVAADAAIRACSG
jgi:adenosylhomocysteine nucleosidase